jgi:hypothetical protein
MKLKHNIDATYQSSAIVHRNCTPPSEYNIAHRQSLIENVGMHTDGASYYSLIPVCRQSLHAHAAPVTLYSKRLINIHWLMAVSCLKLLLTSGKLLSNSDEPKFHYYDWLKTHSRAWLSFC